MRPPYTALPEWTTWSAGGMKADSFGVKTSGLKASTTSVRNCGSSSESHLICVMVMVMMRVGVRVRVG